MAALPKFVMAFQPMTIKHLGLRLYSTLPPVVSELVSNAYDAEAAKVEVLLPTGPINENSEVVVRDYGHGLTADELNQQYLPIGRNRRGNDSKAVKSKNNKVFVTGRKGLGKLSAFGVGSEMEFTTYCKGQSVCLRLNYDEMIEWASKKQTPYEPTVVAERTGRTREPDGVEVRLRKLHRRKAINPDDVRKGLAARLRFIGGGFKVVVNGAEIKPGDRTKKDDCQANARWDVSQIPEIGNQVGPGMRVTGWIGFLEDSSSTFRGVDIFATKKAVELGSFFNFPSTHAQFARAHVIGEVHADFLDSPDEDLVATARNSVVWESEEGQALQEWGQKALRWAFQQWIDLRHAAKEEAVTKTGGFDKWLAGRPATEQKAAKKLIKILVDDPKLELVPSNAGPLIEIIKSSVETVAFMDLLERIDEGDMPVAELLQLFADWRIIEAREHLRLADGRVSAIEKLQQFIDKGALEVQELQPLFVDNLWLIDPAWSEADVQPTYTKLLREKLKEPKDTPETDRRLDILGVNQSGLLTIVELKRPEKTLSREDLGQIEEYVDWARTQFGGSGADAPHRVRGLLLVGKMSRASEIVRKIDRLAGDDIRVETFADLHERSRRYYDEVDRELKKIAPEYSRMKRKSK